MTHTYLWVEFLMQQKINLIWRHVERTSLSAESANRVVERYRRELSSCETFYREWRFRAGCACLPDEPTSVGVIHSASSETTKARFCSSTTLNCKQALCLRQSLPVIAEIQMFDNRGTRDLTVVRDITWRSYAIEEKNISAASNRLFRAHL